MAGIDTIKLCSWHEDIRTELKAERDRAVAFIDWLHDEAFPNDPLIRAEFRGVIEDHWYAKHGGR